jgi:sRNA-binding carbon storage regulator CsrA
LNKFTYRSRAPQFIYRRVIVINEYIQLTVLEIDVVNKKIEYSTPRTLTFYDIQFRYEVKQLNHVMAVNKQTFKGRS